ncbi:RING-type E3 ubiquitin transferase [Ranunculus cassubicifolius]
MGIDHRKPSSGHGIIVFAFTFFFLLHLLPHATAQSNNPNDRDGYNPNFKPSMTVTIVVLAVACLFIGFFAFYIRRCAREVHIDGGRSMRLTRTRPTPRGLEASVIETFPTFLYSEVKEIKIGKDVLECAVCLNEFEDEETLRMLPKCDHVFHPQCIDVWLSSHTTCPVCRADLISTSSSESSPAPSEVQESPVTIDIHHHQDDSIPAQEIIESPRPVPVTDEDPKPEVIDQSRLPIQNRPVRSKSMIKEIVPRSHSTGHSIEVPALAEGNNVDRFTLKLPQHVRKEIMNRRLDRTTSCITFPVSRSGSSVRRSSQSGRLDRGGARSERWLSRATSFFWRNNSGRLSKKGDGGSMSAKSDGMGQSSSSTRPPV